MKEQDGLYVGETVNTANVISIVLFLLFAAVFCIVTTEMNEKTDFLRGELSNAIIGLVCVIGYKAAYTTLAFFLCVDLRIDVAAGRHTVIGPWRRRSEGPMSDFVQLRAEWPNGMYADGGGVSYCVCFKLINASGKSFELETRCRVKDIMERSEYLSSRLCIPFAGFYCPSDKQWKVPPQIARARAKRGE